MRRFLSEIAALALAGCALGDGAPWGRAEVTLRAGFAPPASRLTPEGLLKTSSSFGVRLDTAAVRLDAVALRLRGDDAAPADFDPANPPPGYSLCHGGHCHAADGRLVPYEEVAGGAAAGAPRVTLAVAGGEVALGEPAAVTLGDCPDACRLPRGGVDAVELAVEHVRLSGRVFDLRAGAALDPAGVPFTATVEVDATLTAAVDAPVDEGEPVGVALDADFRLPPELFDGLDFAAVLPAASAEPVPLDESPAFREAVAGNFTRSAALDVRVDRFDE